MDTIELKIDLSPKSPWNEIIVAELAEQGFESFVHTETGILAYVNEEVDVEKALEETSLKKNDLFTFSIAQQRIPYQNWNAKWEADFQPVFVEDYATILAPFHAKSEGKGMIVEIQPQMSFGTGHHQTTWMMTKALFELEKMPKNVLDMGTGTGVLAIVAENLGAENILAIDIEDWSVVNAIENAERNNSKNIRCVCGDIDKVGDEKFGLIIANINKNILKNHMEGYSKALKTGGTLLLSGFFSTDVDELVDFAADFQLSQVKLFGKDEWAAIQLIKK